MDFPKRLILFFIPLTILIYKIFFTSPPQSWQSASPLQILLFFLPLLFFFTFFLNLLLDNLPKSFALGLGLMFLAVLQALRQLNYLTFLLTLLITAFIFNLTPKKHIHGLTRVPKIKKLERFQKFDK